MKASVGIRPQTYRRPVKQSGQAIVLILLLTLAGLVGGVALYSTGILTSEKMQLQNAADASAYSVSVIEARDLNYTAYMNRAMVANEVGIGQMVSMLSWANMTNSTPDFLQDYAGKLDAIICVVSLGSSCSTLSGIVKPIAKPLRKLTSIVYKVANGFSKPVAKGLSIINRMYSLSQQGFHLLSFIFSASTLFEIRDKNIEGSEFSIFGVVALARHFTSYYAGLMGSLPLYGFVQGYAPGNAGDASGLNRLAQVVSDSRDGFTKNRKCDFELLFPKPPTITLPEIKIGPVEFGPITTTFSQPGFDCYPIAGSIVPSERDVEGGWKTTLFGVSIDLRAAFDVEVVETEFKMNVYFEAGYDRQGGTELRQTDGNNYTWSAADTTGPDIKVGASAEICVEVILLGGGCEGVKFDFNPPIPPFGVGAAVAGDKDIDLGGVFTNRIPASGAARDIMYGRASDNPLAWDLVIPPTPWPSGGWVPLAAEYDRMKSIRAQMTEKKRQLNANYNLRRYQDTEDRPEITTWAGSRDNDWISGLEAPYLLIGLVKDDAVKKSQISKGVFELEAPETGFSRVIIGDTVPIGVIAKSEVYYTRPSDILVKNYFWRSDNPKREEKSNAFNPFWQARLVDTSYIDRVAAHAFQHGQLTLPDEADAVIEQAKTLLNKLKPN